MVRRSDNDMRGLTLCAAHAPRGAQLPHSRLNHTGDGILFVKMKLSYYFNQFVETFCFLIVVVQHFIKEIFETCFAHLTLSIIIVIKDTYLTYCQKCIMELMDAAFKKDNVFNIKYQINLHNILRRYNANASPLFSVVLPRRESISKFT